MENEKYLTEQIITYLGNKRKLLDNIATEVELVMADLNLEKAKLCDLFSGSQRRYYGGGGNSVYHGIP